MAVPSRQRRFSTCPRMTQPTILNAATRLDRVKRQSSLRQQRGYLVPCGTLKRIAAFMKSLASANCRSALVFFSVIATASLPWAALDGVTSFVFDEQESPALKGRTLVDSQGFSAASGACRPLSDCTCGRQRQHFPKCERRHDCAE